MQVLASDQEAHTILVTEIIPKYSRYIHEQFKINVYGQYTNINSAGRGVAVYVVEELADNVTLVDFGIYLKESLWI